MTESPPEIRGLKLEVFFIAIVHLTKQFQTNTLK